MGQKSRSAQLGAWLGIIQGQNQGVYRAIFLTGGSGLGEWGETHFQAQLEFSSFFQFQNVVAESSITVQTGLILNAWPQISNVTNIATPRCSYTSLVYLLLYLKKKKTFTSCPLSSNCWQLLILLLLAPLYSHTSHTHNLSWWSCHTLSLLLLQWMMHSCFH